MEGGDKRHERHPEDPKYSTSWCSSVGSPDLVLVAQKRFFGWCLLHSTCCSIPYYVPHRSARLVALAGSLSFLRPPYSATVSHYVDCLLYSYSYVNFFCCSTHDAPFEHASSLHWG